MGVLTDHNVGGIHHFTPLHYLVFIARASALLSKPALLRAGFPRTHFRSMSHRQDVSRGFGSYVHLTLDPHPRIMQSKLAAGFPHVRLTVGAEAVDGANFCLCRYNIAMTRYLRRGDTPGFEASATNGRYYSDHQIPIARTDADKAAMLQKHLNAGTMIEVLVVSELPLPKNTTIACYSRPDADAASVIMEALGATWTVTTIAPPSTYARNSMHVDQVADFVRRALADPNWKGNGLEFDRL